MSIGSIHQRDPLVGRWTLLDQFKIAGVISAKLFENQPVTIDFKAKQLILETPQTLRQRYEAGRAVRLGISRDRDKSLELFLDFVIAEDVSVECKLDTGLDGYVFDKRFMAPLGINEEAPSVKKRETKTLFGQPELQYRTVVPRIRLREQPSVGAGDIEVVFKDRLTTDCLVGTLFWQGRSVTVDIPHQRLVVQ